MDLTTTTRIRIRGLAIGAAVTATAAFFAACGSSPGPAYPPNQPAIGGGLTAANVQQVHDGLLNSAFLAPAGFNSPKMEDGTLTDRDRKAGVASRVHVGFFSPPAAGVSFMIFNSPAQAKAFADSYAKDIPSYATRVSSADAPGAVCADSNELGGFCGFLIGQTFITANATTVAMGAGPLMAAARTTLTTANP